MNRQNSLMLAISLAVLTGCGSTAAAGSDAVAGDAAGSADTSGDGVVTSFPGLTSIAKGTQGSASVELFSANPLTTGINRVFYHVQVDGKTAAEANLVQHPEMAMMGMAHACPVTNPSSTANADGLFAGDLIFQMASGSGESWSLEVRLTPDGGTETAVDLGTLTVTAAPYLATFKIGEGMSAVYYVVAMELAAKAHVGLNDYVISVHQAAPDKMSYAPVIDAALTVTPEMPSMGHGSTGNVDPVYTKDGFYAGKANFSMPGTWRIKLHLARTGQDVGNAEFNWTL